MLTPDQISQIRQSAGASPLPPPAGSSTTSLSQRIGIPEVLDPSIKADKAWLPATGKETPIGVATHVLSNLAPSAYQFGKSTLDFFNPLNTVKTAQKIGTELGEAQAEGTDMFKLAKDTVTGLPKATYDAVVPQFLHHIFSGDLEKAAATLENDPVGQLAPLILVARGAAQRAGLGEQFDSTISTIASPVTKVGSLLAKGAGNLAAQTLGASTGTGASTIKAAAEGTDAFTKAMRGEINPEDVVQSAKDVVKNIKVNRGNSYVESLKQIGEDTTSHDISSVVDEVPKQLENFGIKVGEDGELNFSRSSIANNGSARADIQGVYDTIKDWGTQPGDRTGLGLDILKKQLGDFYSESGQARAFVQAVKSKVENVLDSEVPGYKDMTSNYAKTSNLLDDIKSATSVGGKANPDTVFTKLTSAMKGDKEFRLEVLKEMENSGDPELMDKIAGTNMQSYVPKGLVGRGIDVASAYQVLRGAFSLKFLPMLLSTSPRIVGEFVRGLGLSAQKANTIIQAINTLAERFDMTPQEPESDASIEPNANETASIATKNSISPDTNTPTENMQGITPEYRQNMAQQIGEKTEGPIGAKLRQDVFDSTDRMGVAYEQGGLKVTPKTPLPQAMLDHILDDVAGKLKLHYGIEDILPLLKSDLGSTVYSSMNNLFEDIIKVIENPLKK